MWQRDIVKRVTPLLSNPNVPSLTFLSFFQDFQDFKMASTMALTVVEDMLPMDPFFLAMESGAVKWGDLMEMDMPQVVRLVAPVAPVADEYEDECIIKWWTDEYKTEERLVDWDVPDLTLRSDIEEHFPVCLVPLESVDDRERFALRFDAERLAEWKNSRAESGDEYDEYEEWTLTRLVTALKHYSYKYRIESVGGVADANLVVFAMAHASAASRRTRTAAIVVLRGFPVTWDRDPEDHTRHMIKPHFAKMRELDLVAEEVTEDLFHELGECTDCTVERVPRGSAYMCIVTIPTAAPPAPAPAAAASASPIFKPLPPKPSGPRALDVMRANRLAWSRDGPKHYIKHRAPDQALRIIAELSKCSDCTVVATPKDKEFMCCVTIY